MSTHPLVDRVVVAMGLLMTVVAGVVMHHQATTDAYSVWCDPHVVACHSTPPPR